MNSPMLILPFLTAMILAAAPAPSRAVAAPAPDRPFPLLVGDPAPPLTVSGWVKGEPVEHFEPGHVYVVDLWASWCGPCIAAFPHLSALQEKFSRSVTLVSVNVLEVHPEAVPDFVRKQGEKMAFAVATDSIPDGKEPNQGLTATRWLYGAGEEGIPTTYIIDRDGRLAWEGHPDFMDGVLASVVGGTWNLASWTTKSIEEKRQLAPGFYLKRHLEDAVDGADWDRAWAAAESLAVLDGGMHAPDVANLLALAASKLLNRETLSADDGKLALRFAARGNDLTGGANPWNLGVLGRVHARLGHADQADSLIQRALAAAPVQQKDYYRKLLDEVKAGN